MDSSFAFSTVTLAMAAQLALPLARRRLELSRAKHASLTGHSKMAQRVAALLPGDAYDEERFFGSDGAPSEITARRRAGFGRLASLYAERFARSAAMTALAAEGVSNLQFTGSYRVPYQYSPYLRRHLRTGSFLQSASGVTVTDLDGNVFHDLSGSYGVNVFGVDFYKDRIAEGAARVQALGPVLGANHPCLVENVWQLQRISGLDEVSNLATLVAAVDTIRRRDPRAKLMLVGDGPMRAELAARCPDAIFAGQRTGHDLAVHYASADLFLFPSMTETFGKVTAEAMASGLAVVAYDYAAAARLVRDGVDGMLVPYGDDAAFVARALDAASDRARCRAVGARACASVQSLDWAQIAQRFEQVLGGAIRAHAAREHDGLASAAQLSA